MAHVSLCSDPTDYRNRFCDGVGEISMDMAVSGSIGPAETSTAGVHAFTAR
jgi:hypothetical protein